MSPPNRITRSRRAFTLTEMMVSVTLTSLLMGGIISGVVSIAKANVAISNYSRLNSNERNAVEKLAQDVRQLTSVTTCSATSFTGKLPASSGSSSTYDTVSYTYASGKLTRTLVNDSGISTTTTIVTDITSFTLTYWNASDLEVTSGAASAVKKIQLDAKTSLSAANQANTNRILSAIFTIRKVSGSAVT